MQHNLLDEHDRLILQLLQSSERAQDAEEDAMHTVEGTIIVKIEDEEGERETKKTTVPTMITEDRTPTWHLPDILEMSPLESDATGCPEIIKEEFPERPTKAKMSKRHICLECGYVCNRSYDLKVHHRTHTKERPYTCQVETCRRTFSRSSGVREHERHVHRLRPTVKRLRSFDK